MDARDVGDESVELDDPETPGIVVGSTGLSILECEI
jgi:hypothetical protein